MESKGKTILTDLLGTLNYSRLIETIERGIDMEKLALELNPPDPKEIEDRILDAKILLSCLYYAEFTQQHPLKE